MHCTRPSSVPGLARKASNCALAKHAKQNKKFVCVCLCAILPAPFAANVSPPPASRAVPPFSYCTIDLKRGGASDERGLPIPLGPPSPTCASSIPRVLNKRRGIGHVEAMSEAVITYHTIRWGGGRVGGQREWHNLAQSRPRCRNAG